MRLVILLAVEVRIPAYVLGIDQFGRDATVRASIIRHAIEVNDGVAVNYQTLREGTLCLDRSFFGIGDISEGEHNSEIDYLFRQHKPVVLFRNSNNSGQAPTRLADNLTIVRYEYLDDLPNLVETHFGEIRRGFKEAGVKVENRVDTFQYRGLEVNFQSGEVNMKGNFVHITKSEFSLLGALAKYRGCVLTPRELMEETLGSADFPREHAIIVYISRLNTCIGLLDDGQYAIRYRRNWGYYLPLDEYEEVDSLRGRLLILHRNYYSGWPMGLNNIESSQISNGEITIDFLKMVAFGNGIPLGLTNEEFKLLAILALNKGRVVSWEKLGSYLKASNMTDLGKHAISMAAHRLNNKFRQARLVEEYVTSVAGIGKMMPDYAYI